jgi:hypothetical protein
MNASKLRSVLQNVGALAFILILAFSLFATTRPALAAQVITLQLVASALQSPVEMVRSGDGSGRMIVLEQGGKVSVLQNGVLSPAPFLDITLSVASGAGINFGWNTNEASSCYSPSPNCPLPNHTPPIVDYGHNNTNFGGFSVTEGYRYRGSQNKSMAGYYVYGRLNSYAYAGSNPIMNIDPDALDYWIESAGKSEQRCDRGCGYHRSVCVGEPGGKFVDVLRARHARRKPNSSMGAVTGGIAACEARGC